MISNEHVEKPEDVFKIGQEVTAKIVDFKEAEKKISLSIKALSDDSEEDKSEEDAEEAVAETVEEKIEETVEDIPEVETEDASDNSEE